jgi:hypothetical protein
MIVLMRSGAVIAMTSGSPTREWMQWPSLLRGSPKEAVMVGAGDAVVVRTADDAVYRVSFEPGNVIRARRYLVHPPVLVDDDVRDDGSVAVARLCPVKSAGAWPALVASAPELLDVDPAIANLAAWVRGNGRLAALFERADQVAVRPMPAEGVTYLQLVANPGRLD